jgi:hypothetical protein
MNALNSGLTNGLLGALVGGILWWILTSLYNKRPAQDALNATPDTYLHATLAVSMNTLHNAVLLFAKQKRLRVEREDPRQGLIILGFNASLIPITWAGSYWLPIFLKDAGNGTTTISVGCRQKIPFVSHKNWVLRKVRNNAMRDIQSLAQTLDANLP